MRAQIKRPKLFAAGLPAVIGSVIFASTAFACTIYQGTWTVCGNASTTCVTSTGNGQPHGFTTTGVTAASVSVNVSASGLKAGATYNVNFNDPNGVQDGVDCMGSPRIGGPYTATGGAFSASNLPVSNATLGVAAVCVAEQTPTFQGTGNEAPVTIV